MSHKKYTGAALGLAALSLGACTSEPEISFRSDVMPIIKENCQECHVAGAPGTTASGLNLESYAGLMKGTRHGPIVIAGDSLVSALNMLVEGRADPSIRMPHGKGPLSDEDIKTLKDWVDQGAQNN